MPATPGTIPPTPLDATLGLSVHARRAARLALRHLLPSAPLLGCPVRRLVRMNGVAQPAGGLRWRAGRQPGDSAAPASSGRFRDVAPGGVASSGSRGQAADVPRPIETRPRAPARTATTAARELASAASLVWYARWRETRLVRLIREQGPMTFRLVSRPSAQRRAGTPPAAVTDSRSYRQVPAPGHAPRAATADTTAGDRRTEPVAAARQLVSATPETADPLIAGRGAALTSAPRAGGSAPAALTGLPHGPGWAVVAGVLRRAILLNGDGPAGTVSGGLADAAALPARPGGSDGEESAAQPALVAAAKPAAAVATHALALVERLLRDRVTMEVEETVRRLGARAVPERAERRQPQPPIAAPRRADDRVVASLIDRIRSVERQEQFRHGYLR